MSPAHDARVLLVEDDRDLLDFLQHMLESEKYRVLTAMDGEDALAKARTERPDVILLDVLLPKMHGFEVCQRLRQDPATCLIPIIMVTSLTAIKDRLTGFKLGADEYVSKPFEPIELLARLERLIERTRQNIAANPLTGLPGPVALEEEVKRRLGEGEPFTVGLLDANGFAEFNEGQGFERGDGVLRLLGTILRSSVTELGNRSDVTVHFGADDFGLVTTPPRAEVIGTRVLENVEALIPMQYDEASREKGHRVATDGEGKAVAKPFLSVAVGFVDVNPGTYKHHAQVMDRAREALAQAKAKGGNKLIKIL
jgi:diguanylate cyclase (GGDEF)-like protein